MLKHLSVTVLLLAACGDTASTDAGVAPDSASPSDTASPSDGSARGCTAQVVIGFFTDPACTAAVSMGGGTRTYDTTLSCFSWSGTSSAGSNSATRFQCYRDRLCYTQHPGTLTCSNGRGRTDKQARTDRCVVDTSGPSGTIYARIISGTESCPVAPAGFECPSSASGVGTDGIAACTTGM